jgi:nucleotide-binding universal stress UspA family protein
MFNRILVAYDGSEHSQKAAVIAGDMARACKSKEVWLICVQDVVPYGLGESYVLINELIDEQTRRGEEMLKSARKTLGDGLEIHSELLFGSPAERILEYAESKKSDLIVMGTRGRSGLAGLLLGSQVQKVITHSTCPVLAVK